MIEVLAFNCLSLIETIRLLKKDKIPAENYGGFQ